MNHLTDETTQSVLAGECTEQTRAHLEGCGQCHAEALALRDGISRYGLALRQQALRAQAAHCRKNFAPRKRLHCIACAGPGATVLAMLLAAQTAWMDLANVKSAHRTDHARAIVNARANPQPASMSDDELLEAVNNDLNASASGVYAPVSAIHRRAHRMPPNRRPAIPTIPPSQGEK